MAETKSDYGVSSPEVGNDLDVLNEETETEEQVEEPSEELAPEDDESLEETEDETEGDEGEEDDEEPSEGAKSEKEKAPGGEEEAQPSLHAGLKKAYPEVFKKFPQLKQVIFREENYSQSFATPDDAKEAAEHLATLEPVETGLVAGRAAELVESLGNTPGKVLESVALDFLPTLHTKAPDVFYKVVDPVIKQLLFTAFKQGSESNDKDLANAARWISKFAFGSFDIQPPATPAVRREADPERQAFEAEKRTFAQERFTVHRDEILAGSVGEMLTSIKKQVDPENKLTPFMKDTLTQKVMEEIDSVISSDPRHMNAMASLWRRAAKSNFAPEWKSRIRTAYLARARQVLSPALIKIRQGAGLQPPKATQKFAESRPQPPNRNPAVGRPVPRRIAGPVDPKKVNFDRTSDMDIISDRITLKGN